MQNCRRLLAALRCQQGISLIEVLVGAAITGLIATVVAGLLMATTTSGRSLARQTDDYESLRLPAAMMMQDARFAVAARCGWDYLELITGSSSSVVYRFASWTDGEEIHDPNNLHRWVVVSGNVERDDIVGWSLIPYDLWTGEPGTWFDCDASPLYRKAVIRLVAAPLPGQEVGAHLEVTAFLR